MNELGEKIGYTTKTYNLLAIILMLKNDITKALKIFESALNELRLDTPEGEAENLYAGNSELSSLLINYIKCHGVKNGIGLGSDFFKGDELSKKLFFYLSKVN